MKTFIIATAALLASPFLSAATVLPDVTSRSDKLTTIGNIEKRANCGIEAHWYGNWPSGGFRRYGIRLTAYPVERRKDLLDIFCTLTEGSDTTEIQNKACYANNDSDGSYNADITTFEGQHGHDLYLAFHQDHFNAWRAKTNCDVDNRHL